MIAQIVFDLPIDGPFDYIIPENLVSIITIGMRVKVSFGPRAQIGFVTGLIDRSDIPRLKSILSLSDASAIFNDLDLQFAKDFSAYYGCSLGEALATILRNKSALKPSVSRQRKPLLSLFMIQPHAYATKVQGIVEQYRKQSSSQARFLVLVPDAFRAQLFKATASIKVGMRSAVFEADGSYEAVIMIDDEDDSYKQEQSPMYETRQVLLARARIYGFDVVFIGVSPSVELMALVREGKIEYSDKESAASPAARIVDLTNYKFVPGLVAPPVRDAIEAALKVKKKSILFLNRRGSYRMTRCVDCGEILKCAQCDSALIFSRSEGKFLCRHCTLTAPGDTVCPKCHKPSWRSQGIGVEQVQTELKKVFPQAKIASFERASESLGDFDILIATQAALRFQGQWRAGVIAFIDFDAEINRLNMRSAFNAFSLVLHGSSMAEDSVFIQTRNSVHYALKYLSHQNIDGFYDEELRLRREFGFSPFKHWVKISWRGKIEKSTHEAATQVYNALSQSAPENISITPPLADAVGRKRGQFRFNVMMQAGEVVPAVALIKETLAQLKRKPKVIMTLNIDP